MKVTLDFDDCIKDSPHFRESVHNCELEIAELENQLDRMTKTCSAMVEAGRTYSNVSRVFVSSLDDLAKMSKEDTFVQSTLKQFSTTMGEISNFHSMLFDHAQRSVKNELIKFLKEDVKGARDAKKVFDKSSDDYSSSLSKFAAVNKLKPNEIDDVTNHMMTSRSHFRHVAMDYVVQINMLRKKNRFQTLEKLLSHMHALSTFFHQGYNLMKDLDPFLKSLSTQLSDIRQSAQKEYTVMSSEEERYMKMTGDSGLHMRQDIGQLIIEGHLFKRASNAFKTWHRRWFTIRDNKLFYQKRKDDMTVAVEDIRLCTVRTADDAERRFCFEVISPGKSFLLQGDSDEVREAWISAIQTSIGAAYKNTSATDPVQQAPVAVVNKPLSSVAISRTSSNSSLLSSEGQIEKEDGGVQGGKSTSFLEEGNHSILATLYQVPGNKMCADCRRSDPRWASISLGTTLCIDCSGVHRSLGVHVSKVRSLTLDQWEPEVVKIMVGLGNTRLNEIYEANLPADEKIKANCSNKDRQIFIKAKYVDRKYVMTLPSSSTSARGPQGQKLNRWTVSKRRTGKKVSSKADDVSNDVAEMNTELEEAVNDLLIFGGGGDNFHDISDDDIYDLSQLTPDLLFYKATEASNLPVMLLASCNGASPNSLNDKAEGKSPLMASATVGSIQVCEYLLLNGAKINAKDHLERTALHHAALHNRTGVACQLLKRRVDLDAVDSSGKTALEIAVEDANADIVTLIRLKKMSNQMKEDDVSSFQQNDELVNDVFRDFTRRATSDLPPPQPTDSTFNILNASWNKASAQSRDKSTVTLGDVTTDSESVESSV